VIVADPAFGEPAQIALAGLKRAGDNEVGRRLQVNNSRMFFGPLPGVADEVRALKELLPDASFLVKAQATETALKRVNSPSILHVATHGFFLQDVQRAAEVERLEDTRLGKWAVHVDDTLLRSGLALAGANQGSSGGDDGVLTALEAAGLDLWGTKLVVLSACDTGVGEVKNGDGVYGLRRALVLAGAESQMMSLWPVSDRSTRDLIIGYYRGLLQGQGRGEALRQVQLQMLRNKTYSHPYYWASFIESGEWANLQGKR
jgi:CHAT domain-containing protein